MKTKISMMLLALGLSGSAVYAAHMEETPMPMSNDVNVTAPEQSGIWSFGLMAVLMQPTNAFTYADIESRYGIPNDLGNDTYPDNFQDVKPGYHGWFGADITYAFPGNGRDVTLAYEGLNGADSDHAAASETTEMYSTAYQDSVNLATGRSKTIYNAGDLVFGQNLNVGERVSLHPFAGVRYAYIDVKNTAYYMGSPFDLGQRVDDTWESTFSGIGPRFGSDAAAKLGRGFSVRARLGLSALIGTSSPKFDDLYTLPTEFSGTDTYPIKQSPSTHVVPEIDGRLGVNYTYDFDSTTALGFEVGWQAIEYFNGISMIGVPVDEAPGNNDPSDYTIINSNFGLQGPYARLQLDIA